MIPSRLPAEAQGGGATRAHHHARVRQSWLKIFQISCDPAEGVRQAPRIRTSCPVATSLIPARCLNPACRSSYYRSIDLQLSPLPFSLGEGCLIWKAGC